MNHFTVGQRWISNTDVSLGLGIIIEVKNRRVLVSFPAMQEERLYAQAEAPLSRIVYKQGDTVHDMDGNTYEVLDALDHDGVLIYHVQGDNGEAQVLPEIELDCFVHFNSPKDRLLSGLLESNKRFNLRQNARQYLNDYYQCDAVGLLGPRVQLLPHQLYIAKRVGTQKAPRVLLADEVGLGKTIEAGLILHQQLQLGLSSRVLILVPDALLHQWLVEMLRRFNLRFSIIDQNFCEQFDDAEQNSFEHAQLVLTPLSFLTDNPKHFEQAANCHWDTLLVDEAHHLVYEDGNASIEYQVVEALAKIAASVLLLTATPEQLGLDSHFARLRLLDPDRYYSLEAFTQEQESFKQVNEVLDKLLQGELPTKALADILPAEEHQECLQSFEEEPATASTKIIDKLLDYYGTGRALFRNTRAAVTGFPQRYLHSYPLDVPTTMIAATSIEQALQPETLFNDNWLQEDTRVDWLVQFLSKHRDEKILLICQMADTAIALENHLRLHKGIRSAVFHEHMSLIARDRAAAYFADDDDAAQILVCSEIGSEGRNFQFSQHLVMFDLPLNPDLLEQRIGRLDRIGQLHSINIHVPYYKNSAQDLLCQWYHQGLNAFEQTCAIGGKVFTSHQTALISCLKSPEPQAFSQLLNKTAEQAQELKHELEQGRDKMLELNSCRPQEAESIIDTMLAAQKRPTLESFIEQSCDQFGIEIEPHSQHGIILREGDHMQAGGFDLGEDGFTGTFSKEVALSREDLQYLSWEHPFVQQAFDQILNTEHGNSSVATIKLGPLKSGTLLLEAFYTVQAFATSQMLLNRYLAQEPIRVLITIDGKDLSSLLTAEKLNPLITSIPLATAQALIKQGKDAIKQLIELAQTQAQAQKAPLLARAKQQLDAEYTLEIQRLKNLAERNAYIEQQQIDLLEEEQEALATAIDNGQLVLDAIRLIIAL